MINETSGVSAFVLEALMCKTYVNRLFWMEGRIKDLEFCLECPNMRKEEWTPEVQSIFNVNKDSVTIYTLRKII